MSNSVLADRRAMVENLLAIIDRRDPDALAEAFDGRSVTLPAITMFTEAPAGLIEHYQVWFDVAPLYG